MWEFLSGTIILLQATPFAKRKGLVMLQLTSCHWGMQLLNNACSLIKWWHPLNMWRKCYSMSMDVIYGFHGSQQVFAVATTHWLWARLQTLSVKGVACEANTTRPTCYICTGIEGSYDKISLVCCFQDVNHAAHNTTIQTGSNSWYSLYHGDIYMDRCSSD